MNPTPRLSELSRCFQGLLPSTIATCSADGTPNVTPLSQVYYLDPTHVALSCQFFNKTRRNVAENPNAVVELLDPRTFESYQLYLRFQRSEFEGPLFDAMSLRIQAIASMTGMEGIFRLLSADVYEVVKVVHPVTLLPATATTAPASEKSFLHLQGVQLLSQEVNRIPTLDALLETVLRSLDELFGFRNSMVLVPEAGGKRLVTLASHGYGEEGVGAEVAVGEGIIGKVAEQRRLLRVSHVSGDLRYGRAIRERVASSGYAHRLRPEIPLPGLADAQSQLALPLLVQDRLVGVLALESRDELAFGEWDEALLNILANQVAIGFDKLASRDDEETPAPPTRAVKPVQKAAGPRRTFTLFRNDDCVFVDGEYLIRNVPGLILWKLLRSFQTDGRTEFSNRELRLDTSLKLPELRDNLESRLILLRKRLEQQCPDVRIVPVKRGRFALEVRCGLELLEKESA